MTAPVVKPRVLVVSASDTRFMPFLRGLIASIADALATPEVSFACLDLGLEAADRAWLDTQGCLCVAPRTHLGVKEEDHSPALRSFLARPFLREYFPGYDVYLWIDSDVWLQDIGVFQEYVDGALERGMAITHERERAYRFQLWLLAWTGKHMLLGYGPFTTAHLLLRPHLNAGFFAIRSDAPHWDAWARRYDAAIRRTGSLVPHDQFALNQAIYGDLLGGEGGLSTTFLDPRCNWICDRGIPMWNDAAAAFCKPLAPFEPIGALHLAGPAKRTLYDIKRTGGGSFRTYILRGSSPTSPCMTEPLAVQA
jgi:hypothetical protein